MHGKKINIKKGSALLSLAVVAGFTALLVFTISSSTDVFLGAQAGRGGAVAGDKAAAPEQVRNVSAVAGDQSAVISWDAPYDGGDAIQRYNVRYADRSRTQTVDTRSTNTSFTLSSLTNGENYTVSVSAVNSVGEGVYSDTILVVPQAARPAGALPPEGFSVASGNTQLVATWTLSENRDVDGYEIELIEGVAEEGQVIQVGNVASHTIERLVNDSSYKLRIRSLVGEVSGDWSEVVTATPEADPFVAPAVPAITSFVSDKSSLTLSWTQRDVEGSDQIINYEVVYRPSGGESVSATVDARGRTFSIPNVRKGVEYSIQVRAVGQAVQSDFSTASTATLTTVPGVPQDFAATAGDAVVSLSWTAPEDTGGLTISEYVVRFRTGDSEAQTLRVNGKSTSVSIENLTNETSYNFSILAVNENGESVASTEVSSTPVSNAQPEIIGRPTVEAFDTYAVINWSTNRQTSTRVDFGLLTTKMSTPEYNTETRVVNHEVTVVDLLPCTTYSYQVKSFDRLSRAVEGAEEEFTTRGCSVTSEIQGMQRSSVENNQGGSVDFRQSNVRTRLDVPANLKAGVIEEDVVFQIKKLDKNPTVEQIGIPDQRKVWLGEHVYNFAAYKSETERINDFDKPVTVTISYDRSDVSDIDLNTLAIHHYDPRVERWEVLTNCQNNYDPRTGLGEISCQTSSFSVFGLFAEPSVEMGSGSGSSNSGSRTVALVPNLESLPDYTGEPQNQTQEQIQNNEQETENLQFPNNLWIGAYNTDVTRLQTFLNEQGFTVATQGPGSPGQESQYFGERTLQALKKFQTFYADSILKPAGLTQATGYFGVFTRMFVNQNF